MYKLLLLLFLQSPLFAQQVVTNEEQNRADIRMDCIVRLVRWIESAVLIKENNEWKIQQFHSTVLK